MENLFSYVAALRSNKIRSNATKKPAGKQRNEYLKNAMFSKKEADRIIDFAELTPDQYFAKHKTKIEKINALYPDKKSRKKLIHNLIF